MASLGDISVKLVAKVSEFESNMKKAATSATSTSEKIAKLGFAGAAAGAALAGAAVAGATALVHKVAQLGDAAAKTGQRMGITAEAVQELDHAATLSGTNIDKVRDAFKDMGKNAEEASRGTGAAVDAFDTLGVSLKDANGKLKDNDTLFMETADALSKMENQTQKGALAMKVFGGAGQDILPMLNAGADGIASMRQEARDLGIVMSNDAAASAEHFNDTMERLNQSFEGVKIAVGTALLPVFTALADTVLGLTRDFLKNVDVGKYMQDGLKYLSAQALSLLDTLAGFSPILAALVTSFRVVINVQQIMHNWLQFLMKGIGSLGAMVAELAFKHFRNLTFAFGEVAEAVGMDGLAGQARQVEQALDGMAGQMGKLQSGLVDSMAGDISDMATDFGDLGDAIGGMISGETSDSIKGSLEDIRERVESVGTATLDTAKTFDDGMQTMAKSAEDNGARIVKAMEAAQESLRKTIELARKAADEKAEKDRKTVEDAEQTQLAYENFPVGDFGTSLKKEAPGKGKSSTGEVFESASGGAGELAVALAAATGGTSALAGAMMEALQQTEGFAAVQESVTGLISTFAEIMAPITDAVLKPFSSIVKTITSIMDSLSPVIQLVMLSMQPFAFVLKPLAALFEKLEKPIQRLGWAIQEVVDFLFGWLKKKKDDDDDDDDDSSVTALEIARRFGYGGPGPGSDMLDTLRPNSGHAADAFSEQFSNKEEFGPKGFGKQFEAAAGGLADFTDAVGEATASLTNVPRIFRTELRRGQAAGGSNSGTDRSTWADEAGAMNGGSGLAQGNAGIYVAGDLILPGITEEELGRNARRGTYVRTGSSFAGASANFDLVTAG